MDTSCQGNGKNTCVRQPEFDEIRKELAVHAVSASAFKSAVMGEFRLVHDKLDRIIEGIRIGSITAEPDLDWDCSEPTGVHDRTVWSARAKQAAEQNALLGARVSALQAQLSERQRYSERVREDRTRADQLHITRWKLACWLIAAILSSGGGAVLIGKIFGG
jgi:hypothetical protein